MADVHEVIIVGRGPAGSPPPSTPPAPTSRRSSSRASARAASSCSPPTSRTTPASPTASMGPELMSKFREQAERFGAEFVTADVDARRPLARARSASGSATRSTAPNSVIISTGATARMLGLPEREPAAAATACRPARRATASSSARRRSRSSAAATPRSRRRIFLTKFADQGHDRPPPRRAPGVEDHAGPRVREPEDRRSAGTRWSRTSSATARSRRVRVRDTVDRRASTTSRSTALFVAIGHDPNTGAVPRPARPRRGRLHRHRRRPRDAASRACSPAATCRTPSTARRSPRPAAAAWPRSRPSAGSRPGRASPRAEPARRRASPPESDGGLDDGRRRRDRDHGGQLPGTVLDSESRCWSTSGPSGAGPCKMIAPGRRADRQGARRDWSWQAQRRREPGDRPALQRPGHPVPRAVRARPARPPRRGRDAEGAARAALGLE